MPTSTISAPRRTHQFHALSHAVSGSAWRSAFGVRPAAGGMGVALRVGLAAALMLVVGGLAGQHQLAALASLGALTSAFGRNQPFPRLARQLGLVGTALTASTLIGAALGAAGFPPAGQVAVLAVLAGAGAVALTGFAITGPGAVILVFAASAGVGYGSTHPAQFAFAAAAVAVGAATGWLVAMSPALAARLGRRPAAAKRSNDGGAPAAPGGFLAAGVAGLRQRAVVHQGIRIACAAALAGWAATSAGLDHPLWASMGAIAAMQGLNHATTVQRSIQRLVGNVLGGLLAAGLILLHLDFWPTVALVVLFQILAELLVVRSYILCTIAVTPMALLMTGIGSPLGPDAALSRVADTLLGVALGVLLSAVTVSRSDRHHLPV
ncbi:FUSC family protein [Arthrobacter sp. 35W]|uniref:FUSC family protein n=1 Tax=Arthrobacter sp. 35W TaxID=1132441 RepID=UPI000406FC93|nr:FUSC family protein [Arthrobacter sp. 35W]